LRVLRYCSRNVPLVFSYGYRNVTSKYAALLCASLCSPVPPRHLPVLPRHVPPTPVRLPVLVHQESVQKEKATGMMAGCFFGRSGILSVYPYIMDLYDIANYTIVYFTSISFFVAVKFPAWRR